MHGMLGCEGSLRATLGACKRHGRVYLNLFDLLFHNQFPPSPSIAGIKTPMLQLGLLIFNKEAVMANNSAFPVVSNIISEGVSNACDATKMSGGTTIVTGVFVGAGFILAPHLLAIYGGLALIGAAGRGSCQGGEDGNLRYFIHPRTGEKLRVISVQTVDEFIADPANA
jgi:hypothetical protein